jgi:hypothetical protein
MTKGRADASHGTDARDNCAPGTNTIDETNVRFVIPTEVEGSAVSFSAQLEPPTLAKNKTGYTDLGNAA